MLRKRGGSWACQRDDDRISLDGLDYLHITKLNKKVEVKRKLGKFKINLFNQVCRFLIMNTRIVASTNRNPSGLTDKARNCGKGAKS